MINIYIQNKEKCILGFTFHLFEGEHYRIDYDKYSDSVEMEQYLKTSKGDILGINIERFISFCDQNLTSKTILITEAFSDIRKATSWRANNRDQYEKFISFVLRAESKLIDIVNSQQGENKVKAIMMCKMIIDFAKSESE